MDLLDIFKILVDKKLVNIKDAGLTTLIQRASGGKPTKISGFVGNAGAPQKKVNIPAKLYMFGFNVSNTRTVQKITTQNAISMILFLETQISNGDKHTDTELTQLSVDELKQLLVDLLGELGQPYNIDIDNAPPAPPPPKYAPRLTPYPIAPTPAPVTTPAPSPQYAPRLTPYPIAPTPAPVTTPAPSTAPTGKTNSKGKRTNVTVNKASTATTPTNVSNPKQKTKATSKSNATSLQGTPKSVTKATNNKPTTIIGGKGALDQWNDK